jgi:hypothetical protein
MLYNLGSFDCKLDLYVIDGNLTGQKYRDNVLAPRVVPHLTGQCSWTTTLDEVFRWRQTLARPSVGRNKKRLSSDQWTHPHVRIVHPKWSCDQSNRAWRWRNVNCERHMGRRAHVRLMQRFCQPGNVTDRPRAGRPRKTTPREDRLISRRARQRPFSTAGALRGT